MAQSLDPATREALAERVRFYRDLGLTEFYRRPVDAALLAHLDTEPLPTMQPTPAAVNVQAPAPALFENFQEEPPIPPRKHVSAPPQVSTAVPPTDRAAALQIIRDEIGDCTRCALHKGRNKLVFADGDPNARLMFVGEGPGADEDAQGLPFVGRAGQLLTQMIEGTASKEGIPIRRPDVYICNVVKCRPPENRTPQPDEMEICGQFLYRQLSAIAPKAICALGGTAARALTGRKEGVTKMRGKWLDWRSIPVMVSYHPSYLLRPYNQDAKREAWEDLKKVLHFVYD